jgi:signal transduction histidine kinase
MSSLRNRLLILLIGSWTTVWLAIALVTLNRSGHEIGELLDARLAQTAQVLREISLAGQLPDLAGLPQRLSPLMHPYESKVSFQLWRGGELVSAFGGAPDGPLGQTSGFSDEDIGETRWRVYGLPLDGADQILFVAESYAIRQELIHYLTVQALQPILWSLPVTVLLIWFAVGDGLRPLRRLAIQVGRRSSDRLSPIDDDSAPIEVRPLTNAINGLMRQLDEALSAERRFAADASHELRTPLSVIRTHAQIAQRSGDPVERAEALARLISGVDRAAHLVSQLLVLARLEPDAADNALHAASLSEVLVRVIEDKQAAARARDLELTCLAPQGDPCVVSVLPSALEILVVNLVDNAIKHSPPGGQVRVAALCAEGRSVLRVADSGPGVPVAERERVMERFYRRPGQADPGAGLGLSIVRRICELYGAELVLLDGEDGIGLLVEVRFRPVVSSSAAA